MGRPKKPKGRIRIPVYVDGKRCYTFKAASDAEFIEHLPKIIRKHTRGGLGVVQDIATNEQIDRIVAVYLKNAVGNRQFKKLEGQPMVSRRSLVCPSVRSDSIHC